MARDITAFRYISNVDGLQFFVHFFLVVQKLCFIRTESVRRKITTTNLWLRDSFACLVSDPSQITKMISAILFQNVLLAEKKF